MDVQDEGNVLTEGIETVSIKTWTFYETTIASGLVITTYLLVVLVVLPAFMRYRQPYTLNRLLRFYNAFQAVFCTYGVVLFAKNVIRRGIITTGCPQGKEMEEVITDVWPYFIAKHIDLLDTVFFALRKKANQVTFLHVYHHSAMVVWTWFHQMYFPTDNFNTIGLINSFVHVVMYTYYGLSAMGPEYAKYIWWKKHVTKIQLVQFCLILICLYYQQDLSPCPIPPAFYYYCVLNVGAFLLLFVNFYIRSYISKQKKKANEQPNMCTPEIGTVETSKVD